MASSRIMWSGLRSRGGGGGRVPFTRRRCGEARKKGESWLVSVVDMEEAGKLEEEGETRGEEEGGGGGEDDDDVVVKRGRGRPKGIPAWNRGVACSDSRRAKVSASMKKRWEDPSYRVRIQFNLYCTMWLVLRMQSLRAQTSMLTHTHTYTLSLSLSLCMYNCTHTTLTPPHTGTSDSTCHSRTTVEQREKTLGRASRQNFRGNDRKASASVDASQAVRAAHRPSEERCDTAETRGSEEGAAERRKQGENIEHEEGEPTRNKAYRRSLENGGSIARTRWRWWWSPRRNGRRECGSLLRAATQGVP